MKNIREKYLMIDYIQDKVLDQIKEAVGSQKCDNTIIFMDRDIKLLLL